MATFDFDDDFFKTAPPAPPTRHSALRPVAVALGAMLTAFAMAAVVTSAPVSAADVGNLRRLDTVGGSSHAVAACRAATSLVNERLLGYLPTAATLRAEDWLAGVALRVAGEEVGPGRDVVERSARLAAAGWSLSAVASEAATVAASRLLSWSGHPVAAAASQFVAGD